MKNAEIAKVQRLMVQLTHSLGCMKNWPTAHSHGNFHCGEQSAKKYTIIRFPAHTNQRHWADFTHLQKNTSVFGYHISLFKCNWTWLKGADSNANYLYLNKQVKLDLIIVFFIIFALKSKKLLLVIDGKIFCNHFCAKLLPEAIIFITLIAFVTQ